MVEISIFAVEMSAIPGENYVFRFVFKMRGLVSIIFLIHLVITQGDNSDKTRKFDQMSIKIDSSRNITMQTRQL